MKLRAYSIYDVKALNYHAPFFAHTDGSALRSFADLANDANTTIGRHPTDYSLWCVGEFDDYTGFVTHFAPLVHVADAASLVLINNKPQE